jgi:hypothetical protein
MARVLGAESSRFLSFASLETGADFEGEVASSFAAASGVDDELTETRYGIGNFGWRRSGVFIVAGWVMYISLTGYTAIRVGLGLGQFSSRNEYCDEGCFD